MKLVAMITVQQIQDALAARGVESLSDLAAADRLDIENAEIDDDDVADGLGPCDICGGEDRSPQVDPRLIADFITAINHGDLVTARALVGRVFDEPDDIALVDNAICRCAA